VIFDLIDRCKKAGVVIHVVSDLYNEVSEKIEAEEFGGLRTFRIVSRDVGILRFFWKKGFDFVGSGFLLILLSPLFLIIAWAIKRDSKGPVFYKSEVVGKGGQPFLAYKFRSMYKKGDSNAGSQSNPNVDPVAEGEERHVEFMKDFIHGRGNGEHYVSNENRITRVGRFLRKYSLDEFPQLINVFKGDMSLVGPRFCTLTEYKFYKPWHKRRFQVKPGMAGLWQVRARSAVSYDDMVILDLYYIGNQTFLFDLEILLRTIPVVLYGKGSRIEKAKEKNAGRKD
jgi:Sugar transferases involved in lipopolysaccharide synthesis